MKTSFCAVLLMLVSLISWTQDANEKQQIKSSETKLYKVTFLNGEMFKEKPVFTIRAGYPIRENFFTGKMVYTEDGLTSEIYYPNNKGEYYLKDNYYYDNNQHVVKAVMTMFELQDSVVLNMSYDALGRLEKTRWNKRAVPIKGWFNKLFYKYFSKDLTDEDFHRYYLSDQDSLNHITERTFDTLELWKNHHFELFDAQGHLLKEKLMYVDTTQMGPLYPKTIDTITVQWEYDYLENGLLKMKKKSLEKRSLQKGLPPVRMHDMSITTWEYNYTEDDNLKEEIKIVEQMPSKTGFLKIKGTTRTFKRTHDYLDHNKKHIIYTYDDKGNLEYTTTEIFNDAHQLMEFLEAAGTRKSVDKYNDKGNHISHTVFKKDKKVSEIMAKYTYNTHGDWIECLLSDHEKNQPLYILVERTLEYYP
ncbi:hypothetical protein [Aestuariivivens sediminis]|uniref:hypothetical protein n=1 Tax=Aestuariivivens sediminis TaxID=2913557 RepID=UPI001F573895|nr:hypothetical protein [Aestuariivivens sediminis]